MNNVIFKVFSLIMKGICVWIIDIMMIIIEVESVYYIKLRLMLVL